MVSRLKNRGMGLKLSVHAIRESRKKKKLAWPGHSELGQV